MDSRPQFRVASLAKRAESLDTPLFADDWVGVPFSSQGESYTRDTPVPPYCSHDIPSPWAGPARSRYPLESPSAAVKTLMQARGCGQLALLMASELVVPRCRFLVFSQGAGRLLLLSSLLSQGSKPVVPRRSSLLYHPQLSSRHVTPFRPVALSRLWYTIPPPPPARYRVPLFVALRRATPFTTPPSVPLGATPHRVPLQLCQGHQDQLQQHKTDVATYKMDVSLVWMDRRGPGSRRRRAASSRGPRPTLSASCVVPVSRHDTCLVGGHDDNDSPPLFSPTTPSTSQKDHDVMTKHDADPEGGRVSIEGLPAAVFFRSGAGLVSCVEIVVLFSSLSPSGASVLDDSQHLSHAHTAPPPPPPPPTPSNPRADARLMSDASLYSDEVGGWRAGEWTDSRCVQR
ncbi:hypothetical protein B0H10DRAFT_2437994 [Mycena sp. CBHHK59/15]|nr:hypothetical protein B0H10DRAFT_2437994 [Mycena sp. CBHHK59/15]